MNKRVKILFVCHDGTSDNKPVSVVNYVESGNVTSEELFN